MPPSSSHLARHLDTLRPLLESSKVLTLLELENAMGRDRVCIMILVLCLPFYFPISLPGISTPFGLAIIWIALRELLGYEPRLPQKLASIQISAPVFRKLLNGMSHFDEKSKHWIRPRWFFIANQPWITKVSALIAIYCGIILCLPLPIPFSNWIPALTLLLTFMGRLYGDGLWISCGIFTASLMTLLGFWMADTLGHLIEKVLHIASL